MPDPAAPARPRRRHNVSTQKEGVITTASSIGPKGSPQKTTDLQTDAEEVPATHGEVSVGLGLTESLGQYEFLRVDVRVTLPCGTSDDEVKAT